MILECDRRAEESHHAVAGVVGHRPLEAMHALGEERREALHDVVEDFGIDLLGEIHRALHVGEEDGHLLALALEGAAGGQDLLDEVRRRGGSRWRRARPTTTSAQRGAAAPAEFLARLHGRPARWTGATQAAAALGAEAAIGAVALTAQRTWDFRLRFHRWPRDDAAAGACRQGWAVCQRPKQGRHGSVLAFGRLRVRRSGATATPAGRTTC